MPDCPHGWHGETMKHHLALQIQQAFDRCKSFPEAGMRDGYFVVKPDAYLALIELRNLCPEVVAALEQAHGRHSAGDAVSP